MDFAHTSAKVEFSILFVGGSYNNGVVRAQCDYHMDIFPTRFVTKRPGISDAMAHCVPGPAAYIALQGTKYATDYKTELWA